MKDNKTLDLEDYGQILISNYGENPSPYVIASLRKRFGWELSEFAHNPVNKLTIHDKLENEAKVWQENNGDLLTSANLWLAVRYARSLTSFGYQLSDLARSYVNTSYIENRQDFEDTCHLTDICKGCDTSYRSENLLICVVCNMERCGGCATRHMTNEYGKPLCLCDGILV